MALEIELKLTLAPSAVRALRRHESFAKAAPVGSPRMLLNRYHDTADLRLAAHGVALRTRRTGRRWARTVKCAMPAVGGLSRRPEWETPCPAEVDVRRLSFADVDRTAVRRLLERSAPDLHAVFVTRFRRETRRLRLRPGATVLLMLDRGEIRAGRRRAPICELELELERGTAADLRRLAATLCADLPLTPEDRSKAERGYALAARPAARRQRAATRTR